jgi:peroxiredoxin
MPSHSTPIADQGAELRRASAGQLPADVNDAFEAEREEIIGRGVPTGVAAPGTPMPDGSLLDVHGEPTTLAAVRAGRPAVIVFYRGAWCPYCNLTLRTYQTALVDELDARGITLVAVSPQKPDGSLSAAEKNELTYAVVSDPGNQIAEQLGIVFTLGDQARTAQTKLGLELTQANVDGTADLPLTTAVLVDATGTIRWIDVRPDYTSRTEPAEILAAADIL